MDDTVCVLSCKKSLRAAVSGLARDESGAVTVDWVVLTAAIVGVAILIAPLLSGPISDTSTWISEKITAASDEL